MIKAILCGALCLLLSGCYTVVHENEYGRHVKGFGIDATFYPIFSIKLGFFEYQIFLEKEQK